MRIIGFVMVELFPPSTQCLFFQSICHGDNTAYEMNLIFAVVDGLQPQTVDLKMKDGSVFTTGQTNGPRGHFALTVTL